jgi:hypothetical protein
MTVRGARAWSAPLVVSIMSLLALVPAAGAQSVEALADKCTAVGGPVAKCTELAITARSLQGHVGLMAGLGSEVAGSASTLGHRLKTTPRVSGDVRVAFANVALPDLFETGSDLPRKTTFVIPTFQAGLAVGVFDGFSIVPTVGGVLSLDAFGSTSVLFLPSGEGFGGHESALTLGLRVGIFRESFTLPGVSVSVSHRTFGTVRLGSATGPWGGVELAPSVTSLRATVGKDLLSVGVLAGVGRDWYSGRATLQQREVTGNVITATDNSYGHSRSLFFGGLSMNFLILQISAEAGWAQGFSAVAGQQGSNFDPAAGTLFGSLALRLTF